MDFSLNDVYQKVNWWAAGKSFCVMLWCFCMAFHYGSYAQVCNEFGVSPGKAYYDEWRANVSGHQLCMDNNAVSVLAFLLAYIVIFVVAFLGFCVYIFNFPGLKFYSIALIMGWVWVTCQDLWNLFACISFFNHLQGGEVVTFTSNLNSFQILALWFAETYILLSAAADAWVRDGTGGAWDGNNPGAASASTSPGKEGQNSPFHNEYQTMPRLMA